MFIIKLTYTSFNTGKRRVYYLKRQFHTVHFARRIAERFNYLSVHNGQALGENVAVVLQAVSHGH